MDDSIMLTYGREVLSPNLQANSGVTSQVTSWIVSALCFCESSLSNVPSQFMEILYREGDMSAAATQQRLLYERRNQAAEMRKQITGLMHYAKFLRV